MTQLKSIVLLIILLATFNLSYSQFPPINCPGANTQTLLQSGTYSFTNTFAQNVRANVFQIPVNYNVPRNGFNVAVSTSQIIGFNQINGVDYSIKGGRLNNTNIAKMVLYINSDNSWSSIKASYLISSRNDFILGSFISDVSDFRNDGASTKVIEYSLVNFNIWQSKNKNMKLIYLISGLKTADNSFNINLSQNKFNNGKISVILTTDASPALELIYITYVIFEETAPFNLLTYNPSLGAISSDYIFEGVNQINGNSIITFGYGFNLSLATNSNLNCVGQLCPSSCITRFFCSNQNGVILQKNCYLCGQNQLYSGQSCDCKIGFSRVSRICRPNNNACGINQFFNISQCQCIAGYIRNIAGICVPNSASPSCPVRSSWNPSKSSCVCDLANQHYFNNFCQQCPALSSWNDTTCVCQARYFFSNGTCISCSPNADYSNQICVCNFGYYGNGNICNKCDQSCGTCFNNLSNGCKTCANVSYTFNNGVCTINSICNIGYFFNQSSTTKCQKCVDYCSSCSNSLSCDQCLVGFSIKQSPLTGTNAIVNECKEICGDGIRYYLECDDGNSITGDGCSSTCGVESGWTCSLGNQTSKSQCYKITPTGTKLIVGGHVNMQGQVIQGFGLSYIPQALTNNGCINCKDLLNVTLISSPMIPSHTVEYVKASQYKFVIRFKWSTTNLANMVFNFSVNLNTEYRQYFTAEDMNQVKVITIDSALLIKYQRTNSLTLDDITGTNSQSGAINLKPENKIPSGASLGISDKAMKILFDFAK